MTATERTAILITVSRLEEELRALRALVEEAEAEEENAIEQMAQAEENAPLSDEELAERLFKPRDYACYWRQGW